MGVSLSYLDNLLFALDIVSPYASDNDSDYNSVASENQL